jgi:hypothetical protein
MTLGLIVDAVAQRRQAEDTIERRVAMARVNGVTWDQIAQALGVTRQGAQKRYGGPR